MRKITINAFVILSIAKNLIKAAGKVYKIFRGAQNDKTIKQEERAESPLFLFSMA
ncbi:MAG TPA: hypothetical protein VL442_13215 [Mucilaginibacter sp.]|nr:hypothetical protein [Mucilaginibacter sp.]